MLYVAIDFPCVCIYETCVIEIVCAYQCASIDLYDFNDSARCICNTKYFHSASALDRIIFYAAARCAYNNMYIKFVPINRERYHYKLRCITTYYHLSLLLYTMSSDVL